MRNLEVCGWTVDERGPKTCVLIKQNRRKAPSVIREDYYQATLDYPPGPRCCLRHISIWKSDDPNPQPSITIHRATRPAYLERVLNTYSGEQ